MVLLSCCPCAHPAHSEQPVTAGHSPGLMSLPSLPSRRLLILSAPYHHIAALPQRVWMGLLSTPCECKARGIHQLWGNIFREV